MIKPFLKYKNPDPRCNYPFTDDPMGYCWAFAHYVDGTAGFEDIETICSNGSCECWNPEAIKERFAKRMKAIFDEVG